MGLFLLVATLVALLVAYASSTRLQTSSLTSVYDKGNEVDRITGRIQKRGYGWPLIYLEVGEYQEQILGETPSEDVEAARQAGQEMLSEFDTSGRLWFAGPLVANLLLYLSIGLLAGLVVSLLRNFLTR